MAKLPHCHAGFRSKNLVTTQVKNALYFLVLIGFPPIRQFDSYRCEKLLWRSGEHFHDIQTVLARRIDDRAHDGEVFRALLSPDAPRNIHPQLHHSKSALRGIVRDGTERSCKKRSAPSIFSSIRRARLCPGRLFFRPRFPLLAGSHSGSLSHSRKAFFRIRSYSRFTQFKVDFGTSMPSAPASSAARFANSKILQYPPTIVLLYAPFRLAGSAECGPRTGRAGHPCPRNARRSRREPECRSCREEMLPGSADPEGGQRLGAFDVQILGLALGPHARLVDILDERIPRGPLSDRRPCGLSPPRLPPDHLQDRRLRDRDVVHFPHGAVAKLIAHQRSRNIMT